jgi:vacuolar-type H+-ATPase catalytic subunit A/Vma1
LEQLPGEITSGPFSAGKTVQKNLIAQHLMDIVIIIACGERAGEMAKKIA